ncbi:MAG: hypothetical protein IKZ09_11350 [Clostridia bacterium]|nr:hypothetical protein [Clostridia bacterium]
MQNKRTNPVLAGLLLTLVLVGCAETAAPSTDTAAVTTAADTNAVTEETTEPRVMPDLPENLDFAGHTFTIINNDHSLPMWAQYGIGTDALNGESLNDAIYTRNKTIEDTYNCKVVSYQTLDLNGELAKLVKAGDGAVDVATTHLRTFATHASSGYYIDLHTVESMDLSQPWYDQNSVSEVSIMNRLFGVATDITLMDKQATGAIVFNKGIYANYDLDSTFGDIYTLVRDGKWTLDLMNQIVTSVSSDLDGDGVRTENDLWGLLYQRDTLTSFFTAFDINIATKNSEDIPEMTLINDNNVTAMDDIFDLLYQENYCLHVMKYFGEQDYTDKMVQTFQEDHALMMWIRLRDVEDLRGMETDFGILPMPKYAEADAAYRSAVNSYVGTLTCIPQTNYDPTMTGYFIEALAAESHYTVIPEYYNINLQGKISRDEDSREMLDLIFSNRHYDLGEIYDPGSIANTLIYMTMTYKRDVASTWAKKEKSINKNLEKLINAFADQ